MKSFSDVNSLDPNVIMVVDALNLAFRYKAKGATSFIDNYMSTVQSLRRSYKAKWLIITSDKGTSSYRKGLYPLYKSGRKEKYENQSEEEKTAAEIFFKEFANLIKKYEDDAEYPTFLFPGVEADDIAAYITRLYGTSGKTIWLMSSDKDWDLLISENVHRFSYVTRKEIRLDNWLDNYDYLPEQHISIKCLMGDSGDSVPGVPQVGPTKAKALVDKYGSALDIAERLPIASKYVYINNLNTFGAEGILLNYQLMDLVEYCEEALGPENCAVIKNTLENYIVS